MQDKQSSNQQLVDKAWADMRRRLDREMPVSKFKWSGLALLVLLGLTAIGSAFYYATMSGDEKKEIKEQTAALLDKSSSERNTDLIENQIQNSINAPAPSTLPHPAENETGYTQGAVANQMESKADLVGKDVVSIKEGIASDRIQTDSGLTKSTEPSNTPANTVAGIKLDMTNKSIPTDSGHSSTESLQQHAQVSEHPIRAPFMAIVAIPSISGEIDYAHDQHPIQWNGEIPKLKSPAKGIDFGVQAGSHIQNPLDLVGGDAGVVLSKQLGGGFSMATGLLFGYYQKLGKRDYAAELINVDQSNTPGTGYVLFDVERIYNNSVSYAEIQSFSHSYHYLHLPVTVRYNVIPRLYATAGLRFSYLLNAHSQYFIEQQSNFEVLALGSKSHSNFVYKYDLLHKFDVAPQVGIDLALSPHLSFQAQYLFGLRPLVNKDAVANRSDYLRSLRFGLSYML